MRHRGRIRRGAQWLAAGAGIAVGAYATYAGLTWHRYGRPQRSTGRESSELDRFMPEYDVVERHGTRIAARADVCWAVAREIDLQASPLVRAILLGRELLLGGKVEKISLPHGLLAQMKAIGWGVLAEVPGREIVFGAMTKPWEANPVFRSVPPSKFQDFHEPGWVKIVWTLRVDPTGMDHSIFSTETRAMPTDPACRARFRRYWSLVAPGVKAIRVILLRTLKAQAERRARQAA